MTGSVTTSLKYLLFCAALALVGCGDQKETKKSNNGGAVDTSQEDAAKKKLEQQQAKEAEEQAEKEKEEAEEEEAEEEEGEEEDEEDEGGKSDLVQSLLGKLTGGVGGGGLVGRIFKHRCGNSSIPNPYLLVVRNAPDLALILAFLSGLLLPSELLEASASTEMGF